MKKQQLLEQFFTDVKLEGTKWNFKAEGKSKSIEDYIFSNVAKNSTYRQMKAEILKRSI